MEATINLSDLTTSIIADLGIRAKVVVKRVPDCEIRYNDGRCIKERRGYTVLLNDRLTHDHARFIAILAHELRHAWQYETGFAMTLADNFADAATYAAAPEEVDANAYAATVAAQYAGYRVCMWK